MFCVLGCGDGGRRRERGEEGLSAFGGNQAVQAFAVDLGAAELGTKLDGSFLCES